MANVSLKNANKQVTAVLKASAKLHDQLHVAACSAIMHVLVHKNSDVILRLFNGLQSTSIHTKGLKDWIELVGKVTVTKDEDKIKIVFPKDYAQMDERQALDYLGKVKTFWELSPPVNPFKGFNFDAEMARLLKKAGDMLRATQEGTIKRKGDIVELSKDDIEAIKLGHYNDMLAAYNANVAH